MNISSKTYDIAYKLGAKMDKSFSTAFNAAENSVKKTASKMDKSFSNTFIAAEKLAKKVAGSIVKTVAKIGASLAIGSAIKDSISKAISFESAMADVAKTVDGLKIDGKTTDAYAVMSKELLDMTAFLPMTGEELAKITAAAGQANVAAEDLTKFTETAAKMGIAFDTTAEQSGAWMAQWRTAFKMSQSEVTTLADQINYLSNTSSENAIKLSGVVSRIGSLGEISGISAAEIAAMAAGMTGVTEEISATGIKNLMKAMNAGSAAKKNQLKVLGQLGFSAKELANRMQKDAKGAVLDLLGAFKKLPAAEQSAAITQYFGSESVAAIAPLINNLDNLKSQFEKVGDASQYAESMEKEFASRAATTENTVQLAKNAIDRLQISLGNLFLPIVGKGANIFSDIINGITDAVPKAVDGLKGLGKGLLDSINEKYDISGIYDNLKPKLPIIEDCAKYTAKNLIFGIGKFLKGDSLSSAMGESMLGIKGILVQTLGKESGGTVFSGLQVSLDRISQTVDMVKLNVGQLFDAFGKSFNQISDAAAPVVDNLMQAFGKIKSDEFNILSSVFGSIKDVLLEASPVITDLIIGIIETADKIIPVVTEISSSISSTIEMLLPVISGIIGQILGNMGFITDGIMAMVGAFLPVISGVIDSIMNYLPKIMPVFERIGEKVGYFIQKIGESLKILAPVFSSIFNFICQNIIPVAAVVFENLGNVVCTVVDVIANILPVIARTLAALWEQIQPVLQVIVNVFQFAFGAISSAIDTAVVIIADCINAIVSIFDGIVTFISGVFTGDMDKALQGVRDIIVGIFEGLGALIKIPINGIFGIINAAVDGINSISFTMPDWSPISPGKTFGISLPKIPLLAKGSDSTPNTFIAGEAGAELVTNRKGSKVFTALETGRIFDNLLNMPGSIVGGSGNTSNNLLQSDRRLSEYENLGISSSANGSENALYEKRIVQNSSSYSSSPITFQYNPNIVIQSDFGNKSDSDMQKIIRDASLCVKDELETLVRKVMMEEEVITGRRSFA